MRFSFIQKEPTSMYFYNAFTKLPAVAPLTMEAFVAPADFDPDAQELNIVKAFAAYSDANKKYIFSVGTSATTVLQAITGRSYAYAENGGSYTTIASGTVTWTSNSTKRNVIVIDYAISIVANIPNSSVWAYISSNCYSINANNSTTLNYIHLQTLNCLNLIEDFAFYNCYGLTGNLTIPSSVTTIGYVSFINCSGLIGDLIIPSSVTTIANIAFQDCTGFNGNLIIPISVTSIGNFAFCNCSKLTGNLIIPN